MERELLTSNELMNILGVSNGRFRNLKSNGQLEERLAKIGYKLIGEVKKGRSKYYELEVIEEMSMSVEDVCKNVFNVIHESFPKYYKERTNNTNENISNVEELVTKNQIANKCNCSIQSISNWDKKLVELGIMDNKGYIFIRIEKDKEGNFKQHLTDYEDYKNYIANVLANKKNLKDALDKLNEDKITKTQFNLIEEMYDTNCDYFNYNFVIRYKAYKLNAENPIHKSFIKMLENGIR